MPWLILCFLCLVSVDASAGVRTVTHYLDGTVVEQEVSGRNVLEARLPATAKSGSLRVRPVGTTVIERVETVPAAPPGGKREAEIARLAERQEQLNDRLRALETREEIFRAAAKSQSGKAPRKTKTNPEPLSTIRQGTDYALAQLEEVYRQRRRAEKEQKDVAAKLAAVKKEAGVEESRVRVWITGRSGKVIVSYLVSDDMLSPRYDLRLDGNGKGTLAVHSGKSSYPAGTVVRAALRKVGAGEGEPPQEIRKGVELVAAPVTVAQEGYAAGPVSSVSFTIANPFSFVLPAGQLDCYWKGEFLGTGALPELRPAESREMSCGR